MQTAETLRQRLKVLETEIREAEKRLPAHSVKPQHMAPLLALEDERDQLLRRLKALADEQDDTSSS